MKNRPSAIYVVFLVVSAILMAIRWVPYPGDDPFITYRVSANIAHGFGYVFNTKDFVLGNVLFHHKVQVTSTPLYTILLALLGWVAQPFVSLQVFLPWASWTVCLATMAGTVFLFWKILKETAGLAASVAGAAVLFSSLYYVDICRIGMETSLYCLLIVGAFYTYHLRRFRVAFTLAGLCVLTRLDGLAVFAALAVCVAVERKAWHLKVLKEIAIQVIPALVLLGSWFAWATWYFGQPLPQSFLAKQHHTGRGGNWVIPSLIRAGGGGPILIVLAAVGILMAFANPRFRRLATVSILWEILFISAYQKANIPEYPWYMCPAVVVNLLWVGYLVTTSWTTVTQNYSLAIKISAAAAAIVVLMAPLNSYILALFNKNISPSGLSSSNNYARWQGAVYIRNHLSPGSTICIGGIGIPGFYGAPDGSEGLQIVDFAGLASPEIFDIVQAHGTGKEQNSDFFIQSVAALADNLEPPAFYDEIQGWPDAVTLRYRKIAFFEPRDFPPNQVKGLKTPIGFTLWTRENVEVVHDRTKNARVGA